MCGIVGVATSYSNGFSKAEADAFQDMLFLDTMRGFDSTGVFGVDKVGNVGIAKEASHGLDFIRTKTFDSFKTDMIRRGMFAVGHNRAATRGEVSDKNAHPFWVDDKIVLVQNGTYKGDHTKLKDTVVDTDAVAHVIAETPDVEEALKKINASYALVWYNVDTKTLYLIRNSERPLYLLKTKVGALMWASEAAFIYMACGRNNIAYDEKAVLLPEHVLVELKLGNDAKWERHDTKLDCEYKYSFSHGSWEFGGGGSSRGIWRNGIWYPSWREAQDAEYEPTETKVIALPPPKPDTKFTRQMNAVSPTQCDYTLNELIADNFSEYHIASKDVAFSVVEALKNLNDEGRKLGDKYEGVMVELVDYEAANSHSDCKLWHVFGTIVCMPGSMEEKAVVHWFLRDFTETEVINYIADTFYMARIASEKMCTYNDKFTVVSAFMTQAQPVKKSTTLISNELH